MDRSEQATDSTLMARGDRLPLDRPILALDALSNLTRQFSNEPDFERLIDVLLMTLCGQFSVADSFAVLWKGGRRGSGDAFFATGGFRSKSSLASLEMTQDVCDCFLRNRSVRRVGDDVSSAEAASVDSALYESGVALACPLVHKDRLLGLIGLGQRVNNKAYGPDDVDLLMAITNTITPLVANSYLFWEIANLNAWYLDILNSVRQGVFVFDSSNRLRKINNAGLAILKVLEADISDAESLYDSPIELIFPQGIFGDWAKRLTEEEAAKQMTNGRIVVARAGETERIYSARVSESTENTDMGADLIITLDDVTAEKESEQRLFDLERYADRGLMASSIAHELNNLLALVVAGADIARAAMQQGDLEKAKSALEKLGANLANIGRFTAGLMGHTGGKMSKRETNLNSTITDTLSFVSGQKRFRQITITTGFHCKLPVFSMDSDQIAQLLLNLLNNAADAIDEAGRSDGAIVVNTFYDDGEAVLSISDNGAGIDPEVKSKLFRSRLTTKDSGHGHGLVTCAKIIENHCGKVTVDSNVGVGTTFTIRFPTTPDS